MTSTNPVDYGGIIPHLALGHIVMVLLILMVMVYISYRIAAISERHDNES